MVWNTRDLVHVKNLSARYKRKPVFLETDKTIAFM